MHALKATISSSLIKGRTTAYSENWARSTAWGCLQYIHNVRPQYENVRDSLGRLVSEAFEEEGLGPALVGEMDKRRMAVVEELERVLKKPMGAFKDEDIEV